MNQIFQESLAGVKASEQMYVDEVKAFMDGELPNTLEKEIKILELLEDIECE